MIFCQNSIHEYPISYKTMIFNFSYKMIKGGLKNMMPCLSELCNHAI